MFEKLSNTHRTLPVTVLSGFIGAGKTTLLKRHERGGRWWAAVPKARWPTDKDSPASVGERWQAPVLIGIELGEQALRERFDACLLTDQECGAGPDAWRDLSCGKPGLKRTV